MEVSVDTGRLRLELLGPPAVRRDGELLVFRTRRALALLAYLAVEGGPQPRERLALLFWPESDAEHGRAMLRTTLAHLRDALGVNSPHLRIERAALAFNTEAAFDLDVLTLETAARLARAGRPDPATLQTALMAYRGDFLAGFALLDALPFDEWTAVQRERLHGLAAEVFEALCGLQTEAGQVPAALETARRWAAHDPLNETAHRHLMQLLAASGQRVAALEVFSALRARLAQQLGAAPAPETAALAERLRRTEAPGASIAPIPAAEPPSIRNFLEAFPLVGRAGALARLISVYYGLQTGQTGLVVLQGEAGIGKTRLASTFLQWAAAEGAEALAGRAFEAGGRVPYQPIIEALRARVERENAPEDLLDDIWLSELGRLLPELRARYPDLPAPVADEGSAPARLFEAVSRLLEALLRRAPGPLLLFVDDLQWADTASLDLLAYAARRAAAQALPLLILATVRTEATAAGLSDWLSGLGRDLPVTRLDLEPLTLADTLQLVDSWEAPDGERDATDSRRLGQWLFAETEGQPFYIVETLAALHSAGGLQVRRRAAGGWTVRLKELPQPHRPLPSGVRYLIQARLSQLSPPARALLAAAAVLGQNFTFDSLCQVAGLGEDAGLAALEQSEQALLLHATGAGQYLFTHDKIREAVYAEVSEARQRVFHRRALESLAAHHAPPAELAHHAQVAGLPGSIFQYSLAAGDSAMEVFAVRGALLHYEQALTYVEQAALEQAHQLYVGLGRAYELSGQAERARPLYEALLALARAQGSPDLECDALNLLATLQGLMFVDPESAEQLLKAAMQAAEASGSHRHMAETEWNLATCSFVLGDVPTALTHAERALAEAETHGLRELTARSHNELAYLLKELGRWVEAGDHARQSRDLFAALGNRALEVDSLCLVADAQLALGQHAAALAVMHEALSISRAIENPWGEANASLHLAIAYLEQGTYGAALDCAQDAARLIRAHSIDTMMAPVNLVLGWVQRSLLDLPAARATLGAIVEAGAAVRPFQFVIAAELCVTWALAGEWAEARRWLARSWAARSRRLNFHWGLSIWLEVETLLHSGEVEPAVEHVRQFEVWIGDNPRYRLALLRAKAALAAWHGDRDEAQHQLHAAAALAETLNLPGELWSLYVELGERGRAAEIVQQLALTIEAPNVRSKFLEAANQFLGR